MYSELAAWWPLLSPVADYAEDAAFVMSLLRTSTPDAGTLLELGSGGGNTASHLTPHLDITLSDLSAQMLEVSARLNPNCRHVQGDMRTLRLPTRFDAVLVHDAIDYMLTEEDLAAVLATARAHLRPGGTMVVLPDDTTESYRPDTTHGGTDATDGRGIRYLEWHHPSRPGATAGSELAETTYAYAVRDVDGEVRSLTETHTFGVFSRDVWLRLLAEGGYEAAAITLGSDDPALQRVAFVARAPGHDD